MPGKSLSDIDPGTNPTDDRWTLTKLAQHNYELWLERRCRDCHEDIRIYRKTIGYRTYTLVVDDATLEEHRCPRHGHGRGA